MPAKLTVLTPRCLVGRRRAAGEHEAGAVGKVHRGQPPGGVARRLAADGDVACLPKPPRFTSRTGDPKPGRTGLPRRVPRLRRIRPYAGPGGGSDDRHRRQTRPQSSPWLGRSTGRTSASTGQGARSLLSGTRRIPLSPCRGSSTARRRRLPSRSAPHVLENLGDRQEQREDRRPAVGAHCERQLDQDPMRSGLGPIGNPQ